MNSHNHTKKTYKKNYVNRFENFGGATTNLLGDIGETAHQLHLSLLFLLLADLLHLAQEGGEEGGLARAHAPHHRTQAPTRDPARIS